MSYQREREEFLVKMQAAKVPVDVARLILRHANTLQRLAAMECNGDDWQSGDLVACPLAKLPIPSGRHCPECACGERPHQRVTRSSQREYHVRRRVTALLAPHGIEPNFSGDPRGACLKLQHPKLPNDSWGGDGYCVPTRRY